jgi:hypothetical protein
MTPRFPLLLTLAAALLFAAGCHRHDHDHAHGHGHVHVAPHGGTLVELGDHQFNLELLLDRATGELQVFLLDAHAENFVRVDWPTMELSLARAGAGEEPVLLPAIADPLTGETVGNTATFAVEVPWLRTADAVNGTVPPLSLRGQRLPATPFVIPAEAESAAASAHRH